MLKVNLHIFCQNETSAISTSAADESESNSSVIVQVKLAMLIVGLFHDGYLVGSVGFMLIGTISAMKYPT